MISYCKIIFSLSNKINYIKYSPMIKYDVVVVGAGNAALSSALAAKDNGAKNILVLEKASQKRTWWK